jgi:hypothetical protein
MKNKLVLCILILANITLIAKCQEINYENFYNSLDTTKIETGLLYNRAMPYTNIHNFTGENDTATTNGDHWTQLYFELLNSQHSTPELSKILDLCDSIGSDTLRNRIPIGVINVKYNLIKDNALEDSLLVIRDSTLWDGPNTSESPYTTNRCFAASALSSGCPTSEMTFFINDKYKFENTGEEIMYYKIDFDDGNGSIIMSSNDEYVINYSQPGVKNIQLNAILSNGDTLQCKSTILAYDDFQNVNTPPSTENNTGNDCEISTLPENINDTSEISAVYNNITYGGTYGIWYGCGNNKIIKKPVILVEGYDAKNSNELNDGSLYKIIRQADLLKNLKNQGCDVIVLNFKSGSCPIQANGMVLRELIKKVNILNQTNNELVIVGASMGGLVARYALSYMEQHSEDHKTRLFISLDTPNQGAYGSLAGQHLLSLIYRDAQFIKSLILRSPLHHCVTINVKELSTAVNFMDSYAGRQMLVYHHLAQDGKIAKSDPLRTAFLTEMAAFPNNGYPQLCRKVAISCGNGYGVGQGYDAGAEQLSFYVAANLLTIPSNVFLSLNINALPDHTESKILDFSAGIKIPWTFLLVKGYKFVPILPTFKVYVNNSDPYDNCPGGQYGMLNGLGQSINEIFKVNPAISKAECFVPTVSALDLNRSKLTLWAQDRNTNFLLANIHEYLPFDNHDCCEITDHTITPFDAIYAGRLNLSHISNGGINDSIGNFIVNEINRNTIQLNNKNYTNENKQIEAKNSIIASSTNNSVILANSNITFLAGESIVLNQGFQVNIGSTFNALIHKYECTCTYPIMNSNYTMASKNILDTNKIPISTTTKEIKQDNQKITISLDPNHGCFNLKIDWDLNTNGHIYVYNSMGKLVYQNKMFVSTKQIKFDLPAGVYFLKATSGMSLPLTCKFLINKNSMY